jgi:hypothetical protein
VTILGNSLMKPRLARLVTAKQWRSMGIGPGCLFLEGLP